jgi:hypothetical protein
VLEQWSEKAMKKRIMALTLHDFHLVDKVCLGSLNNDFERTMEPN